jgi:hypothetical protein
VTAGPAVFPHPQPPNPILDCSPATINCLALLEASQFPLANTPFDEQLTSVLHPILNGNTANITPFQYQASTPQFATMTSSSIPQGFSIFQSTLGAHLEFFPAVGTQELDDMINAYLPGPASIQEKRATVAVDFLNFAQTTGQTFKFYVVPPVASFTQSPVSDSASSFNASPATSSWDWSQASFSSSQSSANGRQPRNPSPGTVSRHQTADFSHLPGMKIMTRDGQDVTNTASRGSKTKEQRDHAHLMRIIKACDSCKRKKIRCDPSHKKRGAAQPVQSSKVAKKTKVSTSPKQQQQQPMASSSAMGGDAFLAQASIDWNPSFTFADLEVPEFAMPFDPVEDLSEQANLTPEDYDFLFNNTKDLFSQPFHNFSSEMSLGSESSQSSIPGPVWASAGGSVDSYSDFALYSPSSSFSEDDNMVSIEASSERFSTKSVSQSPAELSQAQSQSQSQSPDLSDGLSYSSIQPYDEAWYNDGIDWSLTQEATSSGALDEGIQQGAVFASNVEEEFYDAESPCDADAENASGAAGLLPVRDRGVANGDLMAAYESSVSADGITHTRRRGQTVNDSSTTSSGRSSNGSETNTVLRERVPSDGAAAHHNVSYTEQSMVTIPPPLPDGSSPLGAAIPHDEYVSPTMVRKTGALVRNAERLAVQSAAVATTTADVQHECLAVQSPTVAAPRPVAAPRTVVVPRTIVAPNAIATTGAAVQDVEYVERHQSVGISPLRTHAVAMAGLSVQHLDHVGVQPTAVATAGISAQNVNHTNVPAAVVAATERSIQRVASGIRKSSVASISPISSQAILLAIGLGIVAVMLGSIAPASVMLSISAIVLRMSTLPSPHLSQLGKDVSHLAYSRATRGASYSTSDSGRPSPMRVRCSNTLTNLSLGRLLSV